MTTNATGDFTWHVSLSPVLCWLQLRKVAHPPPSSLPSPAQSPALLLGHKERIIRQGAASCDYQSNKTRGRKTDERNTLGNYVRLGTLVLLVLITNISPLSMTVEAPETHLNLGQQRPKFACYSPRAGLEPQVFLIKSQVCDDYALLPFNVKKYIIVDVCLLENSSS